MSMWITVVIEQKRFPLYHECGVEIHSNSVYQLSWDRIGSWQFTTYHERGNLIE